MDGEGNGIGAGVVYELAIIAWTVLGCRIVSATRDVQRAVSRAGGVGIAAAIVGIPQVGERGARGAAIGLVAAECVAQDTPAAPSILEAIAVRTGEVVVFGRRVQLRGEQTFELHCTALHQPRGDQTAMQELEGVRILVHRARGDVDAIAVAARHYEERRDGRLVLPALLIAVRQSGDVVLAAPALRRPDFG